MRHDNVIADNRQPLNFAIVLEDPNVELAIMAHFDRPIRHALVVCSGGCTALTLKHHHPHMQVTAFDVNASQLTHTQQKLDAIAAGQTQQLGVGVPGQLHQTGRCEGLFARYRQLLRTHIQTDWETFFDPQTDPRTRSKCLTTWTAHPMWLPIHLDVYNETRFADTFGAQSTQHTEPGSYPYYVCERITRALAKEDAHRNPFLQHILLGYYLDAPPVLSSQTHLPIGLLHGALHEISSLAPYDFIGLSNIFDWTPDTTIQQSLQHLARRTKPGTIIVLRQLNHMRDLTPWFGPYYTFYPKLAQALLNQDRSLFYNRLIIAQRNEREFNHAL